MDPKVMPQGAMIHIESGVDTTSVNTSPKNAQAVAGRLVGIKDIQSKL